MEEFDYEEIVKATDNFNPTRIIGKGSHGMVYKGVLHKHNKKLVAVKKPSQGLQSLNDNSKLENEIRVLSSLCSCRHAPRLIGTSSHELGDNKVIVMELLPNGSLHDWLHAAETAPPTWPKRVEIAMQVALAVQFLHEGTEPLVIHRDIKSANVLFDSGWNARLADFGLAVVGRVEPLSRPAGTIGYIDPSYTTPGKLSTKNDVFSLGVLLLEIVSGRKAIDVCNTPASVVEWAVPLIEKRVLDLDEICDQRVDLPAYMAGAVARIVRVAKRCVSVDEGDRPSAGEVVLAMERYPFWISVLRKRRKVKVSTRPRGDACLSSGKLSMTIKELLAHVTLG